MPCLFEPGSGLSYLLKIALVGKGIAQLVKIINRSREPSACVKTILPFSIPPLTTKFRLFLGIRGTNYPAIAVMSPTSGR
jgi:hypothetical protein